MPWIAVLALVLIGAGRVFKSEIQAWERSLSPTGGAIALALAIAAILGLGLLYLYLPTKDHDE
jgi:hypothetical protein